MAMTYPEFKTYLADMLWRPNDTDLANNTDNLIRMANAELNRRLTIQRREVTAVISPTRQDYLFTLPPEAPNSVKDSTTPIANVAQAAAPALQTPISNIYQIISLVNNIPSGSFAAGRMSLVPESVIYEHRARTQSVTALNIYAFQKSPIATQFFFVAPFSAERPGNLTLTYRQAVPDYQATSRSWLEDEYLDLYVYAVFKHMAVFLREDERIAQYSALFNEALASALDEDLHHVRFGGSPLQMQPHRPIPRTYRK